MSIKNRIDAFKAELTPCQLIAVSKTQPLPALWEAYEAGQRLFGENKVQEMVAKYEALPKDIEWHLLGHLQTNKVKYIAPFVSLIHSVDSLKLLLEIDKQGKKSKRIISCLLQIHIAQEETKFGLNEVELLDLVKQASPLSNVRIIGLMGMASLTENNQQIRQEFQHLKKLFDTLKGMELSTNIHMTELSMGMSSDYSIALQEGSTMVRIGTAIFGNRSTP